MPTSASDDEQRYAFDKPCMPSQRCDNPKSRRLPRGTTASGPVSSDDLLGEAISRLDISDNTTLSSMQIQHDYPLHRARSLDDIHEQGLRERVSITVHEEDEQRQERHQQTVLEASEEDWDQIQEDEEHPDQTSRGEPQACLFVASLAASRTDVELVESVTEHFKKWGPLLNVKVLKDWMQRPYSFVQFEVIEDAQRAMAEAQNTIIDGRHIRIEQARVNRTLFILRFSRTTTERDIVIVLEQFGPVENVSIFHDIGPGRNKRYAFAKFAYRDDAIRAYMSLRNNSKWTVEWAPNLSGQDQIEKESVFVGQLNPELVTEAALYERFEVCGTIQNVHLVKRNKPGASKPTAFAFVEFDDEQSAKRAIEQVNNSLFLGTTIRVQHREASEYRMQRQNAAIQAARWLNMSHAAVRSEMGLPAPPVHTADYSGGYQQYRGPSVERTPMYYTAYYAYPAANMPVVAQGFDPRSQSRAMYVLPSSASRGTLMANDPGQGYYQGGAGYGSQAAHQTTSTEQYGTVHQSNSAQQGYDYRAYMHSPEGLYIPHAGPARVYMYDQGPAVAAVGSVSSISASTASSIPQASGAPPVNPMWYPPARPGGNAIKRVGSDASHPHARYAPAPQGRVPETGSSSARRSPSVDSRGQPRN
ncbi:hypothetical protein BGZ98_010434 [Dissophora globulifera]|nr:hypothetical protein BGZ98_010434 [Dissophora globulifera]